MNPARIWTVGAVLAIVAIVAGAIGLGVQPELAAASAADASVAAARAQSSATQIELAGLSKLAATQSSLEATNDKLGSAITGSLRLSTFSQQIRDTAALDGVTLVSLSPSEPVVYAPTAAATTATGTSTAAAAASGQFGTTNPLITASNFTVIPVTLTVSGSEAAGFQFASDVQHMSRLFAVDNVGYTAGTDSDPSTTTISGSIYALKH